MSDGFVIALVLLYALLAIGAGAIFVFPSIRARLLQKLAAIPGRINHVKPIAVGPWQRCQQAAAAAIVAIQQGRWLAAAAALIIITPVVLVLLLRLQSGPASYYDETVTDPNQTVAMLLRGEQLVPPPPLPPEAFMTREVELIQRVLVSASRDWNLFDFDFQQRLLLAFRLMEERHGYKMVLLEGYRSPERQNTLATMGSSVTNAAAYQSYHQYGLAADCAFLRDGKVVISERDPWAMRGYQLYGEVAESLGLTWGGRWKMMDLGHVEYRKPGFKKGKPPEATPAPTPQ
ncbi:M15 family metallopeptidase [Chitinivorax sp. B]|uniref:M15 family metallopeptidase n=1 Tax=Chitinivorax sp. B TaxID=2502235 RepID=UPI0010F51EF7|nr:M15 family metallopeptidase [Chitinivorax sp. B]